ncbi:DUF883 family protein [Neptunicoccus cionae]|uniref:DUF883 domain-containing protein n=1 Tax=Neptunicoccus cionae TaxID=2035344 RepID=A0A916VQS7_9RHOB|nr:DUF883 family protein [Amylibacter cionae]GGA19290.1 hypothetical protein GCM10011498_20190 [Amylibacter cionae]
MARTSANGSGKDATVADLSAQIETLRKDLSALSGTINDLGKAKKAELKEAATDRVDAAREKGAEAAEAVTNRAKEVHEQANDFVKSQPATALGIAAGLGFLVGMLNARR